MRSSKEAVSSFVVVEPPKSYHVNQIFARFILTKEYFTKCTGHSQYTYAKEILL